MNGTYIPEEVPPGMRKFAYQMCGSEELAEQVLKTASHKVLRRLRNDIPEARTTRWETRWSPENREDTRRWLTLTRNRVVAEGRAQHEEA
jgi:hypothetical protein